MRLTQQRRQPALYSSLGWQAALMALCGCALSLPASAALSDTLHPFLGVSYSTDNNLFRLPDDVSPGPEGRSDTMRQMMFGVQLDRPIGRQRIEANVKLSKVHFSKYDQLDYSGEDADATLHWRLGDELNGTVGGRYSQTLAPFNDFHSAERNLRVQRNGFADVAWRVFPRWQLRSRYWQDEYRFDLSSQKYLDRTERNGEAGVDYLSPTGSTIGVLARRQRGEYPQGITGFFSNENYTQDAYKVKVLWLVSVQSRVEFEGGHVSRRHTDSSNRDASGANGRLTATWSPLASLTFIGAGWREFSPYEGGLSAYSLDRGASLRGSWSPLDRVRFDAQVQTLRRGFDEPKLGNIALPPFSDNSHTASLGVNYTFRDNIAAGASLTRDTRSIDRRFGTSYSSRGASVYLNLQF
ncbi:XrtB/PEP-CTERM-associated polysaccharide biosynthesis outer membrane protein EpsL [Duganella sacchari]|uniref:XrtB/PEP-CTERM-associated polysaccharide biosynthesis outer membrane protein EpsL n=1 Tax=Duganella sacchari TaxID=551987 RepID=UPI001114F888|nr:XrtB/PEP-CTERM-associated polysaccharide biosynthesis outer membrane protein EpsL [Duganella sacchari]